MLNNTKEKDFEYVSEQISSITELTINSKHTYVMRQEGSLVSGHDLQACGDLFLGIMWLCNLHSFSLVSDYSFNKEFLNYRMTL